MVVNFKAREISRDAVKLVRTPTLIKYIYTHTLNRYISNDQVSCH